MQNRAGESVKTSLDDSDKEQYSDQKELDWGEGPLPDERPFGVPKDVELTADNYHEFVPYLIRTGKNPDTPNSGSHNSGLFHFPRVDGEGNKLEPLCGTKPRTGNWKRKEKSCYPPGYLDESDFCSKCLAIANGRDYIKDRGVLKWQAKSTNS